MISHGLGVLALVGPPATLPRIHRAGQPVMVWSLEDPLSSLTSLVQDVGLDGVIEWSDIDSVVMTANMREDAFGIVGGSYYSIFFAAVLSGSLAAHAIQNQMLRRAPPRANFFEWMAGSALPSLDELQTACVPIAMGDGCAAHPLHHYCATTEGSCAATVFATDATSSSVQRKASSRQGLVGRMRSSVSTTASQFTSAISNKRNGAHAYHPLVTLGVEENAQEPRWPVPCIRSLTTVSSHMSIR